MTAAFAGLLGLALATAAGVVAAEPAWQFEAGAGAEHLSGGAPDWRQLDATLRHRFAPRSLLELSLRRTQRSGLDDHEIGGLVALPLGDGWNTTLAATSSPSHRVLARHGARIEVARAFDGGWVASGLVGRRLFDAGGTTAGNTQIGFGVERYVDVWRLALALGTTRLDGGGSAGSLRLQVDRSFAAERGRVGVILARGRELEGIAATPLASADVIDQRVTSLALVGSSPLANAWALTGVLSRVRNDDLQRRSALPAGAPNQRSGVRIGVRHDF